MKCFAFRENSGEIDIESMGRTELEVRERYLEQSMGWRYEHPDRYPHDEWWEGILEHGSVVEVSVVERTKRQGEEVPGGSNVPTDTERLDWLSRNPSKLGLKPEYSWSCVTISGEPAGGGESLDVRAKIDREMNNSISEQE